MQDAQNALRRIMETHSAVTRFCFICNYVSRIIEPLASRCAKFRFKPLHEGIMEERVTAVARAEGVRLGDGAMAALGRVSNGDLRRALTTLQSAYALHGSPVHPDTIIDVAGEVRSPHPSILLSTQLNSEAPVFLTGQLSYKLYLEIYRWHLAHVV